MPDGERLQKVLAAAGLASRREAEGWIAAGRVSVNGLPATLGQRVSGEDEIRVDGRMVRIAARRAQAARRPSVYLCHRSPGEILESGIAARLPGRGSSRAIAVSPMPRIDGGLEVVALDGGIAASLQRAIRSSRGEFSVRVRGSLEESGAAGVLGGELDDGSHVTIESVAPVEDESDSSNRWYAVTAVGASGKAVRQLFERQGCTVSRVLRVALGPFVLTRDLPRGRFRPATEAELALLGVEAPAGDAAGGGAQQRNVRSGQRVRRDRR